MSAPRRQDPPTTAAWGGGTQAPTTRAVGAQQLVLLHACCCSRHMKSAADGLHCTAASLPPVAGRAACPAAGRGSRRPPTRTALLLLLLLTGLVANEGRQVHGLGGVIPGERLHLALSAAAALPGAEAQGAAARVCTQKKRARQGCKERASTQCSDDAQGAAPPPAGEEPARPAEAPPGALSAREFHGPWKKAGDGWRRIWAARGGTTAAADSRSNLRCDMVLPASGQQPEKEGEHGLAAASLEARAKNAALARLKEGGGGTAGQQEFTAGVRRRGPHAPWKTHHMHAPPHAFPAFPRHGSPLTRTCFIRSRLCPSLHIPRPPTTSCQPLQKQGCILRSRLKARRSEQA